MNTEKIDSAVALLQTGFHKTACLHWAIRVGKSVALQTLLRTSNFEASRVLIVSYDPVAAKQDYLDALCADLDCVKDFEGIDPDENAYDCIIFDDIEWCVKSIEEGLALYERAVALVGKDGYVFVAGTQNYGICDELKNRVSFYSKITTPEVHPEFLEDVMNKPGNALEEATFKRDYLLILTDEKF